ncbi:MAG: mechanosensitive ion channel [Thermoprotei archaeon]|nr:mechanosensitive ion channel [Thermoprotei archaeon]
MTKIEEKLSRSEYKRRGGKGFAKMIALLVLCASALMINDAFFVYAVSPFMPAFSNYKVYIDAIIVLGLGYMVVNSFASSIYWLMRMEVDYATASLMRTIVRIMGIAILLAILTSVFNVNPSAALTVGSFVGMVVGFATQNVLNQAVAGIFLALTRPFKPGDSIKVAGQEGIVKEIGVMRTIIVSEDGSREILIPSSSIVNATIIRMQRQQN